MDRSTARSRQLDANRTAFLWVLLPTLLLVLNAPDLTNAQVVTNITPSALPPCPGPCGPGVTLVTRLPPGQGGTITITGGARPGNGPNLFHSFGQFDVGTGDIANFFNETGLPTNNILSRVTGGNPSQIYGTIQTTDFPGANLFLMNPAGVLFGATAVLDLGAVTGSAVREPGSFYATTADYLNLGDATGASPFYADPVQASVLSVAPVVAFGFTAPSPVSITIEGSTLMVGQGKTLSIVGGNEPFNKTIQEAPLIEQPVPSGVTVTGGTLSAPGGQIQVVSVASPGEVLVPSFQTGPNINGASFTTMGTVTLKEGAILNVSGQLDPDGNPVGNANGGTVLIRGGQLVMDASLMLADTYGSVNGLNPGIDIEVAQDITLTGAAISIQAAGPGRAGDVLMTAAGTLGMQNGAGIFTGGVGGGGNLLLNVGTLTLTGGPFGPSLISTTNSKPGTGLNNGNVTVQGTQGEGTWADSVVISGGSQVLSQTGSSGDGGQVTIAATSLTMSGQSAFGDPSTINSSTSGSGKGGDIVVAIQQLKLLNGANIRSQTHSAGSDAGKGGSVTVQGQAGQESQAVSVTLSESSGIISETLGSALPGNIALYARTLSLTSGAVIANGTKIDAGPAAGDVMIRADSVDISGGSSISSQTSSTNAGQVTITAKALTLDNGSIITTTLSAGRGGNVQLTADGTVNLLNGAQINSSTTSSGRAGDITIKAGSLTLTDRAQIASASTGSEATGNAGDITINSASTFVMQNSLVTTEAELASGGQIVINAPEMVRLTNSQVSTSVKGVGGESDGGNITIDPQFVILQNSQIIAQANAGAGGAINVTAGVFLADPNSLVDASSQQGPQGTVNIQSPVQNVAGELTPLSQQFSRAAALLAQQCAARAADGKFSTFVVAGREGLPVEPGGFLASPSLTAELLGSSLTGWDRHTRFPAVTGLFPEYDARPIQLAKFGDACR